MIFYYYTARTRKYPTLNFKKIIYLTILNLLFAFIHSSIDFTFSWFCVSATKAEAYFQK